jgi:hypothetical protein
MRIAVFSKNGLFKAAFAVPGGLEQADGSRLEPGDFAEAGETALQHDEAEEGWGLGADGIPVAPPVLEPFDTAQWNSKSRRWDVSRETGEVRETRLRAAAEAQLAAEREAMELTNVELSEALYLAGKISAEEAEAFASTGAIPAPMLAAINQVMVAKGLTAEQQVLARIKLKGLMVYQRSSPLVPLMGEALGMDAAALDLLFSAKTA